MLCLLRFGRIFRLIGRVMSLMFSALTLYEWGPFRRSWGCLGAVLGYASSGASSTIAVSISSVPFSGWNLCQLLRWLIMPRMISMRWVCSVQPMSRKCSMLDLVESRFFSSVMLMVRIVLAFRCRFVLAYIYHYTGRCTVVQIGVFWLRLCGGNLIHAHVSPDAAICSL